MKIRFQIDLDRADGELLAGGTDLAGALCVLLESSGALRSGTGSLETDAAAGSRLVFAAHPELGVSLCMEDGGEIRLTCGSRDALEKTVEVRAEKSVSAGLFLPLAEALDAIRYFAETGTSDPFVTWITPEELPEGGCYFF
ncbi:MAG: hypothetical protein MJ065_06415 [Oscillospiraceae bacterium]|nr:hypothetical protein [Oscillospiraceae bacterium]